METIFTFGFRLFLIVLKINLLINIGAGPLMDGFTHFQLIQKTQNTRTQYTSANITLPSQEHFLSAQQRHLDTTIANSILKKGTRNSFHLWSKEDYDLAVTRIQIPHVMGGFGLTPNVLAQSTAKVVMTLRFVGMAGSLPPDEQQIWFPNQLVDDPQTWVVPHLFQDRVTDHVADFRASSI